MLEAQQAVDLLLLHQILSSRYSAGVVQKIQAQLNRADADLFARLQVAIEDTPGNISAQAEYLTSMLASVRTMNAAAYSQVQVALKTEMRALAAVEVQFNARIYGAMAGSVPLAAVGADSAYAAAMSRPFQGRLLREIVPEMGEARMRRIRDSVRTGFVTGKTSADIVRELRGTKKAGFVDAFLEVDRRHLETVVHSALGHTAATAREQFMEANKDVIASQIWLSTIDSRVSSTCLVRSNKRYTTGENPKPIGHEVPWGTGPGRIHWNALAAGTAVKTADGYKPIESIVIGDVVITHTGALKSVLDVRSKLNESGVIRVVRTQSGHILRATHDHPVMTAAGWNFIGALEVGDKLFRELESQGKMLLRSQPVCSKPDDGPAIRCEPRVSLLRSLNLCPSAVGLESDLDVRAREIEDRCASLILRNPPFSALDESTKHHLFATAHALQKLGRNRLANLLSDFHANGIAPKSFRCPSIGSSLPVGGGNALRNAIHSAWVVCCHAMGVARMNFRSFFGHPPCPMSISRQDVSGSRCDVSLGLLGFCSNRKVFDDRPFGESAVCEPMLSFNASEGLPKTNVLSHQQGAVVGEGFCHDAVVSLEMQHYSNSVYDLEVEEDCSYVASSVVVSNCRSVALGLLPGQDKLFGQRASIDGPVDANLTYSDWLSKQTDYTQNEVLGVKRAALFRDGGLKLERFADDKGRWLTLDEIKKKDAEAFTRAGL